MRVLSADSACLVRSQQYIRTCERRHAGVFDDVVVVTDQDTGAQSARKIKHGVLAAAADGGVLERLDLAMEMDCAVGEGHYVCVMEDSVCRALNPSCADGDGVTSGQVAQAP